MKYYTEEHEWVEVIGDEATVGISEYAASEMGRIVGIELPEENYDIIVADHLGEIEFEDDTFELISPVTGTVTQINDQIMDEPEIIIDSPEDKGWICKLENIDTSELDDLMTEDEYTKYTESL